MAEINKNNPYEGLIAVTQNPYAGTILVEEPKEKKSIGKELYRTLVGAARDLAVGTLNFYDFSNRFKPTEIAQAFNKAKEEKDLNAINILNNALNKQTSTQIAIQKIPEVPEPDSTVGKVSRDLLQFAGGYSALSKDIATAGAKTVAQKVKQGTQVVGLGSAAEQIAFSPYEQRLSNFINEAVSDKRVAIKDVSSFLQADQDDNEAVARFKMALEGAGLAIPIEALFRFAPKFRANKKVEDIEEIKVPEENKIIPEKPEEIKPITELVTEGPYAGAKVFAPPTTKKRLPPSLQLKEPKIKRVNSLLFGEIPKNDPMYEEIVSALGYSKDTLPPIYRSAKADVSPVSGIAKTDTVDYLGTLLRDRGVVRKDDLYPDEILQILQDNPPLPEFQATYTNYLGKKYAIDETLDLLERNNINPAGLSDSDVSKILKQINENESYTQSIIDSIEAKNISKQQTDNIYQDMMARERSTSITLEDLQKIPARKTEPEVAMDFVEKDYGFSKKPTRNKIDAGDDKYAGNINLNKINEPTEIKNIIKDIAKDNDSFLEARRGVVKFGSKGENLEALSRELGFNDSTLLKRKMGQAFNAEEAYAARLLFDEALKDAYDLAAIAKTVNASQVDLINFQNAMARVAAIQEQIAGITAEAGRTLRSFREVVGPASTKNPEQRDRLIKEFVATKGGDSVIKDIANKMTMLDDPAQLAKFARDQYKPKFLDYVQEFWINALLSSPSTHIVNTLSNALVAGLTPIEYFGAAAIGKLRGGDDIITFGEAGSRLLGTLHGTIDGIRAASKAIVSGETVDPLTKLELRNQETIPGLAGKIVRLPGTALVAEDAFFKSIGYRQELWGQAFRKAQQEKQGLKRAYELMRNPDEISPNTHLDAVDIGRYQTFTNPLGEFGQKFQRLIQKYPGLRFIFPFVRTPVNIVNYAFERTPAGMLTDRYKQAIKKGGREADLARAKIAVGAAIGSSVLYYANAGLITGRGPSDSRKRSILMETGWQPYSIKIGDSYYNYNRFEPVGILFGITADISDIGKYIDRKLTDEEQVEIGKLMSMLSASFTENITNKTFLTGLSDTIEMINDPDRYGEATIQRFISSFVPTFSYYERKADDPVVRDVQSFSDAFANRFPEIMSSAGFRTSEELPAKRNVFGEIRKFTPTYAPLGGRYSPVKVSNVTNDYVFNEFVKLDYVPPMPKRKIGDVDLTPEQYETLLSLQQNYGTKNIMTNLILSPGYKKLTTQKKIDALSDIFRRTQGKAREDLYKIYPDILQKQVEKTIKQATE